MTEEELVKIEQDRLNLYDAFEKIRLAAEVLSLDPVCRGSLSVDPLKCPSDDSVFSELRAELIDVIMSNLKKLK